MSAFSQLYTDMRVISLLLVTRITVTFLDLPCIKFLRWMEVKSFMFIASNNAKLILQSIKRLSCIDKNQSTNK